MKEIEFQHALLEKNRQNNARSIDFTGWDAYEAIEELLIKYWWEAYNKGYEAGYDDGC